MGRRKKKEERRRRTRPGKQPPIGVLRICGTKIDSFGLLKPRTSITEYFSVLFIFFQYLGRRELIFVFSGICSSDILWNCCDFCEIYDIFCYFTVNCSEITFLVVFYNIISVVFHFSWKTNVCVRTNIHVWSFIEHFDIRVSTKIQYCLGGIFGNYSRVRTICLFQYTE